MSLATQYVVIGLMVVVSLFYMVRKLAPKAWRRWQAACAGSLDQPSYPAMVRALGRFLQPKQEEAAGCHSGGDSSCSACNACGSGESAPPAEQPLTFHPRSPGR